MMRRNRAGKQKANPSNRMEGTGSQKQPDILFLRCEMKGTQEEHPSLALRVADEEGVSSPKVPRSLRSRLPARGAVAVGKAAAAILKRNLDITGAWMQMPTRGGLRIIQTPDHAVGGPVLLRKAHVAMVRRFGRSPC